MLYLKVPRKHFASGFPSASDDVQRTVVQHTREDDRDYGHGHHEPDRWCFGPSDRTADKWTKASCESPYSCTTPS